MSSGRILHDPEGLNSGTWPVVRPDGLVTPTERFFTRTHGTVPTTDATTWRLRVDGLVHREIAFSLADLVARFPRREVTSTLLCAGARRAEFLELGPLPGELPWGPEPVSTAVWSGVSLTPVLEAAGIQPGARHVEFIGADQVERLGHAFGFGGSIDLAKALAGDVLLATHMNGAPLPPAHGFPLRAIVPGWIGARSVKWLDRIRLLDRPSENYFQAFAYRVERRVNPENPRDVSLGTPLSLIPLNSAITSPVEGERVTPGPVTVQGWAIGNEGSGLATIEVSADGGRQWHRAEVVATGDAWTWTLWECTLPLAPGRHQLAVRATDVHGATQPEQLRESWNVKGYVNNAWHRVRISARYPSDGAEGDSDG